MAEKNRKNIDGRKKIKELLPHRKPFIFIDDIIEFKKNKKIVATKHVKKGEYFLKGHFPGNPIMPGVLTTEAAVQTGLVFFRMSRSTLSKGRFEYYLLKNTSEFITPIYPGDTMVIEVTPIKILYDILMGHGVVRVRDRIAANIDFIVAMKKK